MWTRKGIRLWVKFSRKNQSQYIGSETAEGKQTKWSLVYQDGKWVEA